ncbi:MAG: ATP-binding protein [Bdellovibrionales bacterium]
MVFIGGPRQVGKTTLARSILAEGSGRYLNWDSLPDKAQILSRTWSDEERLIVLDELHKYPKWKSWIKGVYDTEGDRHRFLVTGSARLDVYKKGGDSLMGRYHYWRLHPFSLSELPDGISAPEAFRRLLRLGGFPEPFLGNDEVEARRWRRERFARVLRDDVRDLEPLRNIQSLELLVELLRTRVGSPVVVSNLAEDLQVSPLTVKNWLEVLERMYLIFLVKPYTRSLPRAIQKPPKVYFFDNADVSEDDGARFENLVATHLLKQMHFLEDSQGYRYELRYIRDKEGREVDFVVLKEGKMMELIEAKWGDSAISRSLLYYADKLNPPRVRQVIGSSPKPFTKGKLRVESAIDAFAKPL